MSAMIDALGLEAIDLGQSPVRPKRASTQGKSTSTSAPSAVSGASGGRITSAGAAAKTDINEESCCVAAFTHN